MQYDWGLNMRDKVTISLYSKEMTEHPGIHISISR
jgi:hypothetical protein